MTIISILIALRYMALTGEEMKRIKSVNKNCRMIKGQVFLWKDVQGWEDLWDRDGEVTPP